MEDVIGPSLPTPSMMRVITGYRQDVTGCIIAQSQDEKLKYTLKQVNKI